MVYGNLESREWWLGKQSKKSSFYKIAKEQYEYSSGSKWLDIFYTFLVLNIFCFYLSTFKGKLWFINISFNQTRKFKYCTSRKQLWIKRVILWVHQEQSIVKYFVTFSNICTAFFSLGVGVLWLFLLILWVCVLRNLEST